MIKQLEPLTLFLSYAHEDEQLKEELVKHLSLLQRQGLISAWHDRQIQLGTDWAKAIDEQLERASIILLLISPDFLASDYCYGIEMKRALERHSNGEARVIPIVVRFCDWSSAPFAHLQGLPTDARPINKWSDKDEAWTSVVIGLRRTLKEVPQLAAKTSPAVLPPIWNIPYTRNSLFTGRDDQLTQLATILHSGQPTALSQPQAISGLGGIGKTQIALEYAYRYRQEYQAVLWVQADTREVLTSSYLSIAALLNLPEKSEQESARVVNAVKNWLKDHSDWLLILDNADDLTLARDFLPPTVSGHILITTRAHVTGRFAHRVEVDVLPPEQGIRFLLDRAGLLTPDRPLEQTSQNELNVARAIYEELGGLPLALDQVGAYLEETGCSLIDYKQLYQHRRATLLAERRGQLVDDHPLSVATTWSLSFEYVEQKNPAATDLLRLCAFLAPDAIPEIVITEGAPHLGPNLAPIGADPYLLNQAIEALRAHSLLYREAHSDTEPQISVHRLVQSVLKDQMDKQSQQQWTERAVLALNAAFPDGIFANWPICERLLPHALHIITWIENENLKVPGIADLLNQTGYYLNERVRLEEAEPLLQKALEIRKEQLGLEHPDTATSLNHLGELYRMWGKYTLAEPLLQQALAIREIRLGLDHSDTAISLNNLALLYYRPKKYAEAESLLQRALAIWEARLGSMHSLTANCLNNLGELYRLQGKYAEAELLLQRALAIQKEHLGSDHPDTATSLNNLALLYSDQEKYAEAEILLQQALAIQKEKLGTEHPNTVTSRNNLTHLQNLTHPGKQLRSGMLRVYCPCEKQCSAYSGANRKCNYIEASKAIPSEFMAHIGRGATNMTGLVLGGFWGGLLAGAGAVYASSSDEITYEVWQCPGCHCKVLYQITKQAGGIKKEPMGEISSCKE